MCETCDKLRARLDEARAQLQQAQLDAENDRYNAATDMAVKNRQLTAAKRELDQLRDGITPRTEVEELLEHWKKACRKTDRVDVKPGGKRYKLAQAAIKRWGLDRCKVALTELGKAPYAGTRGRSSEEYPGSKRFDDVEHALSDEVRFERLELMAEQPAGPVNTFKDDLEQARQEQFQRRMRLAEVRIAREVPRDPVNTVLEALHAAGVEYKATAQIDSWSACCPAHDDRSPSLSISRSPATGYVLIKCWSGCETDDVLRALRLEWTDLFPDTLGRLAA